MRRVRQKARDEDGFTLVEVVVAMVIILIGVLGTLVLIDRANSATVETRTRQTANNILRDLLDTAQGLPYTSLTTNGLVPALQARGFADSVSATTAWEITRNGTTQTVTASVCAVDDPGDGSQNSHPASSNFCSDSPAGTGDSNGDDYRRVTLTIAPPIGFGAPITATTIVGQTRTANIGGTGSGAGSSSIDITQMKIDTSAGKTTLYSGQVARCPGSFLATCPAGVYGNGPTASTVWPKQVYFTATTASTAQKVKFAVDGKVYQTVTGPGTTFNSTWTLPDGQPDGTYSVTAQVFDASGVVALSDPKPVTTILNRYLPDPNAFAATSAGRNHQYLQSGSATSGTPEVETYPSNTAGARLDRDIVGFQTMRYVGSATGVLTCSTNSVLIRSCQDTTAPLKASTVVRYRIIPYALNADGTQQIGNGNPPVSSDVNLNNTRPCSPRNVTVVRSGTVVTISWLAPLVAAPCATASGDPDSGDCIDFYRVYTKAAGSTTFAFGDRVDRSPFGVAVSPCGAAGELSTSITLWEATSVAKSYQVTAVDTKLDESVPAIPTGCGSTC